MARQGPLQTAYRVDAGDLTLTYDKLHKSLKAAWYQWRAACATAALTQDQEMKLRRGIHERQNTLNALGFVLRKPPVLGYAS